MDSSQCCATVRMMVAKLKGKNPKRQHWHREKYIVVVIAGGEAKAGAWTEVETDTFQGPCQRLQAKSPVIHQAITCTRITASCSPVQRSILPLGTLLQSHSA